MSLLDESGTVTKIGTTVFNNGATATAVQGKLNEAALETLEKELHAVRPAWVLVRAQVDAAALSARLNEPGWTQGDLRRIRPEFDAMMKASGADAAVMVEDHESDNYAGRGVGVRLRSLLGFQPHLFVYAHLYVALRDARGDRIAGDGVFLDKEIPVKELGVTSDIESLDQPRVKERLAEAMQQQTVSAVGQGLHDLGY